MEETTVNQDQIEGVLKLAEELKLVEENKVKRKKSEKKSLCFVTFTTEDFVDKVKVALSTILMMTASTTFVEDVRIHCVKVG